MRRYWPAVVGVMLAAPQLRSQAPADSMTLWTTVLQSGTATQRGEAIEHIAGVRTSAIPSATRSVMIAELRRLNSDRMRGAWSQVDEATGEYYMSLVSAVARLETPAAYRALIPSVGLARGIGQRVARLGDDAVAPLQDLIARNFEKDAALYTLGLVWYWADTTGSRLSSTARAGIVSSLVHAYGDRSFESQLGLQQALANTGDPVMVPFAQVMQARARSMGGAQSFIANSLTDVIAELEARERALSTQQLATRVVRSIQAVCETSRAGPRQGACQSLAAAMTESIRRIDTGETAPARAALLAVVRLADRARADGALADAEHALTAGAAQRLLARLP